MAVAIRVGSGPVEWLEDPRATVTAIAMIREADERARRR